MDRLPGSKAETLLHAAFDDAGVKRPSVGVAVHALALGYAQSILRGGVSPGMGAVLIAEVEPAGESGGVPRALVQELEEMWRLMTVRDDAKDDAAIVAKGSRSRAAELRRTWEQEYDREIEAAAAELLARAGLGADASPDQIALAAARWDE